MWQPLSIRSQVIKSWESNLSSKSRNNGHIRYSFWTTNKKTHPRFYPSSSNDKRRWREWPKYASVFVINSTFTCKLKIQIHYVYCKSDDDLLLRELELMRFLFPSSHVFAFEFYFIDRECFESEIMFLGMWWETVTNAGSEVIRPGFWCTGNIFFMNPLNSCVWISNSYQLSLSVGK